MVTIVLPPHRDPGQTGKLLTDETSNSAEQAG
ncbi:hypothetical protein HDA45_006546 [Amycolatopsis umgeniensis]|uniref:Uncharacterized protein n=1 Tax=Amycolatopsis umgeniensis TaxID=336628 RepID=A0A841B641_9PSEU|nr:hypothetical protein [Amycolatopsis umgeniensis]